MSVLSGYPYYWEFRIIGISVLSGFPYYRDVRIIRVSVLSGCPYYRSARLIRDVRIIGVSVLSWCAFDSGCPYYRGVRIKRAFRYIVQGHLKKTKADIFTAPKMFKLYFGLTRLNYGTLRVIYCDLWEISTANQAEILTALTHCLVSSIIVTVGTVCASTHLVLSVSNYFTVAYFFQYCPLTVYQSLSLRTRKSVRCPY